MGARAGYTLLTGLFIGLGGMLGFVSFFVELIPRAVLAPILIFVALDIIAESFLACPARHAPAVAFAFFPTVARLLAIRLGNPDIVPPENLQRLLEAPGKSLPETLVTIALGNGFILTAMLWGGFLAELIDRRLMSLGDLSADHGGADVFRRDPFRVARRRDVSAMDPAAGAQQIPYQFAIAYAVLAAMLPAAVTLTKESREPAAGAPCSVTSDEASCLMKLADTFIRSLPKVLLHDHLDGGLRPQTVDRTGAGSAVRRRFRPPTPAISANGFTAAPSAAVCRCIWKDSRTPAA